MISHKDYSRKRSLKNVLKNLVEYLQSESLYQSATAIDHDELELVNQDMIASVKVLSQLKNHLQDPPLEVAYEIEKILDSPVIKEITQNNMLFKIAKALKNYRAEIIICNHNSITEKINLIKKNGDLSLSDPISRHSSFLYKTIYSKPHIFDKKQDSDIARDLHGIEHVNRVAYDIPVLRNLYQRYGDEEVKSLTDGDIKLIQIAALLHDAAREKGTGIDYWDHESALLAYYYFKDALGVPEEKARKLAEAIANKDTSNDHYFKLDIDEYDQMYWNAVPNTARNIYQKLLHDADSLDIIRARKIYNYEYLDFYQEFAQHNKTAKKEMIALICEIRSLIEYQGDGYLRQNEEIKQHYESKYGYQLTEELIATKNKEDGELSLLNKLYHNTMEDLLVPAKPYDPQSELNEENMQAALHDRNIYVFSRSVMDPSAIMSKHNETLAELELRKTLRRPDIPTRANKLGKEGNPNRSVALLGFGFSAVPAVPYASSGFLIVHSDDTHEKIKAVHQENIYSGYGKKKDLGDEVKILKDADEKTDALNGLIDAQEKGNYESDEETSHNEIIYHVTDYNAIFYTNDPVYGNCQLNDGNPAKPYHKNTALLQAIFLQKEYEKQTGKTLPIFDYSGIHSLTKKQAALTDQQIAGLWAEMSLDFFRKKLTVNNLPQLTNLDDDAINNIKIYGMYGALETRFGEKDFTFAPADRNYSDDLKHTIHEAIKKMLTTELNNFLTNNLEKVKNSINLPRDLNCILQTENKDLHLHAQQIIKNYASKMNFSACLRYAKAFKLPVEDQLECLAKTKSIVALPEDVLGTMVSLFKQMPEKIDNELFDNMSAIFDKLNVKETIIPASVIPDLLFVIQQLNRMAHSLKRDTSESALDIQLDALETAIQNSTKIKHHLPEFQKARKHLSVEISLEKSTHTHLSDTKTSLFHHPANNNQTEQATEKQGISTEPKK